MRDHPRPRASAIIVAVACVLACSGCAGVAIDASRRNLVSVGAGWGRLNTDSPAPADVPESERKLDLANAFALDATYARRLTGPRAPVGLFGEGVLQWVPPSGVEGNGAAPGCDVGWVMTGAGLRLQSPPVNGVSISGDVGYGVLRASQSGCGGNAAQPGSPGSATAGTPFVGLAIDFHLSPRVAWSIAIRSTRLPLDELGLGERRWGGAGSFRIIIAF
jgi:hypothetical protein